MKAEEIAEENATVEVAGKEHEDKRDTKEGGAPNAVEEMRVSKEHIENQLDLNGKAK